MSRSKSRWRAEACVGIVATLFAVAGATTCYQATTIPCCSISSPAPNLTRTCIGSGSCYDLITSNPNTPWVTIVSIGKNLGSPPPSCTCTWDKWACGIAGITCYDTGTTGSGTGTGIQVNDMSACTSGGPGQ